MTVVGDEPKIRELLSQIQFHLALSRFKDPGSWKPIVFICKTAA
jgi:hypothetical protein